MRTGIERAAIVWRGPVSLLSGAAIVATAAPRCACEGLRVVPVLFHLRGEARWTFVACVCTKRKRGAR